MKQKIVLLTIFIFLFSTWIANAQSLEKFFNSQSDLKDLGRAVKSLPSIFNKDTLQNERERKHIDNLFYPMMVSWGRKENKQPLDSLEILQIGYGVNSDMMVTDMYLSLNHQASRLKYLVGKFGQYSAASAFGYVSDKTEPTTYFWELEKFNLILFVSRNSNFDSGSGYDLVIIKAK